MTDASALPAPGDPFRWTTIAHAQRTLLGPLAADEVAAMLGAIDRAPRRILDVGCGRGAMLVGAMVRFSAGGVGVEPNPHFASWAQSLAEAGGVADSLTLHRTRYAAGLLGRERFGLSMCIGATGAFEGYEGALEGLHAMTEPGGYAIIGEGYWARDPASEYLEVLGAARDEMSPEPETRAKAEAAGWRVVRSHSSTPLEWDSYEDSYAGAMAEWLGANPRDPDAPAFRARLERWRDAYLRWGRDTLGFATYLLARR